MTSSAERYSNPSGASRYRVRVDRLPDCIDPVMLLLIRRLGQVAMPAAGLLLGYGVSLHRQVPRACEMLVKYHVTEWYSVVFVP